jgi:uncharacterized protein (DUF305 family)
VTIPAAADWGGSPGGCCCPPFDKHFLTMMITHHDGAVTMVKQEAAQGANPDARALAEKIIADQQAEITTMKGILGRLS